MPCGDSGVPRNGSVQIRTVYRDSPEMMKQISVLEDRCDELARYLCFSIGELKDCGRADSLPEQILKWSKEHHSADENRVRCQMVDFALSNEIGGNFPSAIEISGRFIEDAERVHPVSDWHKRWFVGVAEQIIAELHGEFDRKSNAKPDSNYKTCPSCGYFEDKSKWSHIIGRSSDGYGSLRGELYVQGSGEIKPVGAIDLLACPKCNTVII